jgi:hypothetical protein
MLGVKLANWNLVSQLHTCSTRSGCDVTESRSLTIVSGSVGICYGLKTAILRSIETFVIAVWVRPLGLTDLRVAGEWVNRFACHVTSSRFFGTVVWKWVIMKGRSPECQGSRSWTLHCTALWREVWRLYFHPDSHSVFVGCLDNFKRYVVTGRRATRIT